MNTERIIYHRAYSIKNKHQQKHSHMELYMYIHLMCLPYCAHLNYFRGYFRSEIARRRPTLTECLCVIGCAQYAGHKNVSATNTTNRPKHGLNDVRHNV